MPKILIKGEEVTMKPVIYVGGVSGTTCNALFKEKSDAIAYTNLYNYNLAVEQHQKLCDELFSEMHGLYSIYSRPHMRGKGVIISEDQI